ncbi:MAG TPA: tol-pal system protein YbgF [Devosia sp.]|nr:tol-pal system protein YbgF [Devosia sp.]
MKRIEPEKRRKGLMFAAALAFGFLSPAFVSAESNSDVVARMELLEFQTRTLSQSLQALDGVFDGRGTGAPPLLPPAEIGEEPVLVVAQRRETAALNVRLSQLEEQMRVLVGQVEGLQFQMTQFQTLIERMQEDTEFRFQQLEGGASGKTDAATRSGGAMLSGGLPQDNGLANEVAGGTPHDANPTSPVDLGGEALPSSAEGLDADSSGFIFGADGDRLGGSTANITQGGQALELDFDPGTLVTDADADAQYSAGFEALMQGDYLFAQNQFRQFVDLFPAHPLAPDATNWLGESLLRSAQYDEAAQVLFEGFQRYETSTRAPDLLLNLGVALAGAGETDTACRTFGEVSRRFPNMGDVFSSRVNTEMAKARC